MIKILEKQFCDMIGLPYAVTFWKGRVALYAILRAMGIGLGDEVVIPGFTCVVVPNSIIYCGAKPVFVDIAPGNLNIDMASIKKTVSNRTKAIIVQHTFGIPADIFPIQSFAREKGIFLIEDCAHCLGSSLNDRSMGTFGDAAFFSLQWSKPVTTGLGGIAVTGNPKLGEMLLKLQDEAVIPSVKETLILRAQLLLYTIFFNPVLAWFALNTHRLLSKMGIFVGSSTSEELMSKMPGNYLKRYPEAMVKIACKKLSVSGAVHRKRITAIYDKAFGSYSQTFKEPEGVSSVLLRYPLIVKAKEDILKQAEKENIEIGDWFLSPVHPNLDGWNKAGYISGSCPQSEACCKSIINLPTHPKISEKVAYRTISFIQNMKEKGFV